MCGGYVCVIVRDVVMYGSLWQVAARPRIQRKLDEEREREEGVRWRCRVRQRQRDVEFV